MSGLAWKSYRSAMRLSPGIADAVLSSLAGFAASFYAVRFLDAPELGAFALYFSASLVGGLLPQQLIYLPSQIAVLEMPSKSRSGILQRTLLLGAVLSLLVTPFVASAGLLAGSDVGSDSLIGLAAGGVMLTLLTPMQDHVRSTLYLCDLPERGALVSACQFLLVLPCLAVLHVSDLDRGWVPFSALSLGLAGSMMAGLFLAPRSSHILPDAASTRSLLRAGRPLLPAALIQEGTVFATGATLVALTSAATLGTAEAARIVSRPVQTLSLGISRSLAPRLMESGQSRDSQRAFNVASNYVLAMTVFGSGYLLVAGWDYGFNPFVSLFPAAYEEAGLVALFIVVASLGAIAQVPRGVLLGAGLGKTILLITSATSVVRLAGVALLAAAAGAFALPLAQMVSLVVSAGAGSRAAMKLLGRDRR